MKEYINQSILNNTVYTWLVALGTLTICIAGIALLRHIIIFRLKKWSVKTKNTIDDMLIGIVEKQVIPLLYIGSLYLSFNDLTFPDSISRVIKVALLFATTYFILGIITSLIKQFIYSFIRKEENSDSKEKQARGLIRIINWLIWIIGIIFLIDNLGYKVTTLIAGLGIGGIAIALAAQAVLGDLFSYFVIFFDRPFEIGDFIVVEDKMGTVEYIGVKTTRIRTLGGEQLVCSNTYLTNARVHNYKRMEERRVVFKIGVTYQTSHEQLRRIPQIVKDIIDSKEHIKFDRGHFAGMGDFSLNFEFVYYVDNPDFNSYMDHQQSVLLDIIKSFEDNKIEFAYPTQTIFINKAENTSQ